MEEEVDHDENLADEIRIIEVSTAELQEGGVEADEVTVVERIESQKADINCIGIIKATNGGSVMPSKPNMEKGERANEKLNKVKGRPKLAQMEGSPGMKQGRKSTKGSTIVTGPSRQKARQPKEVEKESKLK